MVILGISKPGDQISLPRNQIFKPRREVSFLGQEISMPRNSISFLGQNLIGSRNLISFLGQELIEPSFFIPGLSGSHFLRFLLVSAVTHWPVGDPFWFVAGCQGGRGPVALRSLTSVRRKFGRGEIGC